MRTRDEIKESVDQEIDRLTLAYNKRCEELQSLKEEAQHLLTKLTQATVPADTLVLTANLVKAIESQLSETYNVYMECVESQKRRLAS